MNISEASRQSGLQTRTIRFYEDIGLVTPARGGNGYRDFGTEDVRRLAMIARARGLGFGVDACRALLALRDDSHRESANVKRIALEHLTEIDEKIAALTEMRAELAELVRLCPGDSSPHCGILDKLGA